MGHKFAEIAFTPSVRGVQEEMGSRASYARMERGPDFNDALGPDEAAFIGARDSFYMATVGETGWPYVQHRGGPAGFVKVLDAKTLGFADFRGNRQYVSVGNVMRDDRVSLLFMDYPNRARLKLLGRATLIGPERPELLDRLAVPSYRARIERGFLVRVEAFDWNCPQHITQRFTRAEVEEATAPLRRRIAELEALLEGRGEGA
jgi:predicted pyridoxine 5'-phosphate oxidase superfamily flavin-nucleotide-binding protein